MKKTIADKNGGYHVEMTEAEILKFKEEGARDDAEKRKKEIDLEIQKKLRLSAVEKFKAMGLTSEEIDSIIKN